MSRRKIDRRIKEKKPRIPEVQDRGVVETLRVKRHDDEEVALLDWLKWTGKLESDNPLSMTHTELRDYAMLLKWSPGRVQNVFQRHVDQVMEIRQRLKAMKAEREKAEKLKADAEARKVVEARAG